MSALIVAHVLLSMTGFAGLLALNVYTLFITRQGDAHSIRTGLTAWRKSAQVFGPMLLMGVILGFALSAVVRVSLTTPWLVATYVLVIIAVAIQGAVMAPWQFRANEVLEAGQVPPVLPVVTVLLAQCVLYTAIAAMMLLRPA